MNGIRKQVNGEDRRKARLQAIRKAEAKLRKQTFFDPTYDTVFKKIFEKMETLVHFLNAILHLEGEHRFVYAELIKPSIILSTPAKKQKIARFDVHARTANGQFIDIEMQRADHEEFLERIELYSALLTINAKIIMDDETSPQQRDDHPYRMPTVFSIWICNFDVKFCNSYHEEISLFRHSDLRKCNPLPIYPKKRYIIVDLTKFASKKDNSPENEWINLFKNASKVRRAPKVNDSVLDDVYERLKISNATSKFIKKVATDMVTKEEISTRMGTARCEGEAIGEARANKKFAARDKKIAKFLRTNGVSAKLLNAALAIK
ncbi:MAG: PD-(D/E)XK nuclease family transposase [Fibrobacter sp.]|nr:PD-(D/E)XK nuclease family transposase [Fibrobacter sp.]